LLGTTSLDARLRGVGSNFSLSVFCEPLQQGEMSMGRGILLWLLGVPIPIIILIALFYH
jgi:hypothetical protein